VPSGGLLVGRSREPTSFVAKAGQNKLDQNFVFADPTPHSRMGDMNRQLTDRTWHDDREYNKHC
jgi:hypothetical protein